MVTKILNPDGMTYSVFCKKNDIKPIEGMTNASTLVYIDEMAAGAMLFDQDEKCWWDREGNRWTF